MKALRLVVSCALLAGLWTACTRTQALEKIPVGTEVTVMTQDGKLVTGRLKSVEPERVVIASNDRPEATTMIERTHISEVSTKELPARTETREYVVPTGTALAVTLDTALASDANRPEDPVRATLSEPVRVDDNTVIPAGSSLMGFVTAAKDSGKVQGRAELGLRFDRLRMGSVTYDIRTEPLYYRAKSETKEDLKKVGIGAAAGGIIGAITGGKKGAAIGSAVGGGAGGAVVLATEGDEVKLNAGRKLRVELVDPLPIRAK